MDREAGERDRGSTSFVASTKRRLINCEKEPIVRPPPSLTKRMSWRPVFGGSPAFVTPSEPFKGTRAAGRSERGACDANERLI